MGHRVLELLAFRDKQYKRETKLIGILQVRRCARGGLLVGGRGDRGGVSLGVEARLVGARGVCVGVTYPLHTTHTATQFVSSTVWKALFNKVADSLERSTENEDECAYRHGWIDGWMGRSTVDRSLGLNVSRADEEALSFYQYTQT